MDDRRSEGMLGSPGVLMVVVPKSMSLLFLGRPLPSLTLLQSSRPQQCASCSNGNACRLVSRRRQCLMDLVKRAVVLLASERRMLVRATGRYVGVQRREVCSSGRIFSFKSVLMCLACVNPGFRAGSGHSGLKRLELAVQSLRHTAWQGWDQMKANFCIVTYNL